MTAPIDKFLTLIKDADLPTSVQSALEQTDDVKYKAFDESYLSFLDRQIRNKVRGPEWNRLYTARRKNLGDYAGKKLLNASVVTGSVSYSIYFEPMEGKLVHWECLSCDGFEYLH